METIQEGLVKSFQDRPFTSQEYIELYSAVYTSCINGPDDNADPYQVHGSLIYNELASFALNLSKDYAKRIKKSMEKSLETYAQLWRLYHQGSERVSRFSEYLERFWIQRELANLASSNRVRPILAMFLDNWRQNILMNEELELLRYLFESVDSLRNLYIGSLTLKTVSDAHLENSATINIINAFFSSVHCIQDFVIADEFLAKTASYYEAFFSRLLRSEEDPQKSIVREYIVVANKILDFERHAVATVYIGIVPRQLERTLIDTIVSPNLPLLFREFPSLLKEFNTDLILAAYTLIATEGERAVEIVRRNYEDHVVTCCEKYVKKMCDHSTLISDTLRYVNAMTKECSLIFPNDKHFSSSVSKALKVAIGFIPNIAQAFSLFIKDFMRTQASLSDESQIEDFKASCSLLFKYLSAKDEFKDFYGIDLSDRLLRQSNPLLDLEMEILRDFTECCGPDFSMKLYKMIQDRRQAIHDNEEFHEKNPSYKNFNVLPCAYGSWPFSHFSDSKNLEAMTTLSWPLALSAPIEAIISNYMKSHAGRRLTFVPSESFGELTATFKEGRRRKQYTFVCSAIQMSIILLCNEKPGLETTQICRELCLTPGMLRSASEHMIDVGLLIQDKLFGDSKGFKYSINGKFRNAANTIVLNTTTSEEDAIGKTESGIFSRIKDISIEHRMFAVQAAIVRTLKQKQSLSFDELFEKLNDCLAMFFTPPKDSVANIVDMLVDKGYITKTEDLTLKYVP